MILVGESANFMDESETKVTPDLLGKIKTIWPTHEIYNGLIGLLPVSEIEIFSIDSDVAKIGLVRIAGGSNGDPILVDSQLELYYFDHDNYSEGQVLKCLVHYGELGKFLDEFCDIDKIPADAESLREIKKIE